MLSHNVEWKSTTLSQKVRWYSIIPRFRTMSNGRVPCFRTMTDGRVPCFCKMSNGRVQHFHTMHMEEYHTFCSCVIWLHLKPPLVGEQSKSHLLHREKKDQGKGNHCHCVTLLINCEAKIYSSPACSVWNVKLFMLARKKSSRCTNNKFTLNRQILALLSLMWKIMQLPKNGKKYFYVF
jgi:hypothetical protein